MKTERPSDIIDEDLERFKPNIHKFHSYFPHVFHPPGIIFSAIAIIFNMNHIFLRAILSLRQHFARAEAPLSSILGHLLTGLKVQR